MIRVALLALAAQQTPTPAPSPAPRPQPIARVVVSPAEAAIHVGDTIRLRAQAFDSAGAPLPTARIMWFAAGGMFEGSVDSTGLVRAGATGTLVVSAMATMGGATRPTLGKAQVAVLPRPASRLAIRRKPSRVFAGTSVALEAVPYDRNGDRRQDPVTWGTSRPAVAQVNSTGRLTARAAGQTTVTASAGEATERWTVTVVANPIVRLGLEPATATARTGDVVRFTLVARDAAGRAVSGATADWSVAPGQGLIDQEGAFVAYEPGTYRVLAAVGSRVAAADVEVTRRDARRPVDIVGRLPIKGTMTMELWLHPDGKHAYVGTFGDRLYAVDIRDPSRPVITDSVMVDARAINDVMTTEDGKYGVLTREGASSRRNGIVIMSFEDPAHPRAISEFTETVTGGVHSTFVYRGYVYLTDDATGSMRVIDIRDPMRPKQVARWQVDRPEAGRMLHDIDVRDGLAYLSYWNDGLVILDVGNGIKGGSPENPQLVTQHKYELDALYRRVEQEGGPGFIRGTHTAWRKGNYVFVGDEVFSASGPVQAGEGFFLGRAYGRLHVIDVSDLANPREVAWYEPPDGGVHNVWVAGDTLYVGDYQGGLRVLDVSGELLGDLLAQGREVAHVHTGDSRGFVPNTAMTWGAIYRDGLVYVPDVNSGLWIVRVRGERPAIP
jgi:plastocyanin